MRTQQQKSEILARLQPTQVYENAIDALWLARLKTVWTDSEKNYKNTGPVTVDFWPERQQAPEWWLEFDQLLKSYVGEHGTFATNFFEVKKPHILHNDDNERLWPRLHKTVVIPMEVVKPTYFAVMDQCYLDGPVKIRSRHKPAKRVYYNKDLTDNSVLYNYTGKDFDKSIYDKYFTHQPYDAFHGLSVERIAEWKPGNIIVFDTARIHTACNFLEHGIQSKLGFSVFTYLL